MATIRNPQQVVRASCDDTRIGRCAHDMEDYHPYGSKKDGKSPSHGRREPSDVAESSRYTGGCLNPSAEVLLAERETQPSLPLVERREDRTAASDLTELAPRSHSTLKVGQLPTCGEGL